MVTAITIPAPTLQSPLAVADTALVSAESTRPGSLPSTLVNPPVSSQNTRFESPKSPPSAPAAETPQTTEHAAASAAQGRQNSIPVASLYRPSSAFLAQILAQSSGPASPATSLLQDFARGDASASDYPVMLALGTVKYLPSYASKPRPELQRIELPEAKAEAQTSPQSTEANILSEGGISIKEAIDSYQKALGDSLPELPALPEQSTPADQPTVEDIS